MATVTGGGSTTVINAGSNDANGVAQALANTISAGLASGGNLTRTTGPNPATGYGVLTISTTNASVADQPAVSVNLINGGGAVVAGGFVNLTGTGGPNQMVLADNENLTFFTNGGSGTVVTGDGNNFIGTPTVGGGQFSFTTGNGNDVINAISGQNTVSAGGGNNFVFTGFASDTVFSTGNDTVSGVGGTAGVTDTIFGGNGTTLIGEFNKNLTFVGGNGQATVLAGNGSYLLNGGVGGGLFAGGKAGNNLIAGGTGAVGSTIFGGGNGDVIFARGSARNLIAAGSGNETLSGAGSSGDNIFFNTVGNSLILGGSGNDTFFVGSGNSTVNGGIGADVFAIQSGSAGGTVSISNFNSSERVTLLGYGPNERSNAIANQVNSGGSTTITLSDNTRITFVGISSISNSSFS